MATVPPFHVAYQGQERHCYHTNTRCGPGSAIPVAQRIPGDEGFRHCSKCVMFDADDWMVQEFEKKKTSP